MVAKAPGIDIETETLLTIEELCRHPIFRRSNGEPCAMSKPYRLIADGLKGVKLEAIRIPAGIRSSREAVVRFVDALTRADGLTPPAPCATRRRSNQSVDAELDRLLA